LNGSAWPLVVLIIEYTFFVGLFGQTPGMFVTGLRCVSVNTGGPIGPPRAALRALLLVLIVPALVMDADGRGLHDRAAGSIVLLVRQPRFVEPRSVEPRSVEPRSVEPRSVEPTSAEPSE
jgi:uncharacterized RDD family membrane protein YckC